MSSLSHAVEQMRAAGMPEFPAGHPVIGAGKIIRYGPKKKAWYVLYEFRLRNGQYVVGGSFGAWGEIPSTKIDIDWKGIAAEERERHQRERAVAEAQETRKRQERATNASGRAWTQWNSARSSKPAGVETYLDRKGVEHEKGLRYFADGTVIVPMIRYAITEAQEKTEGYSGPRRLLGLQKIAPDGTKLFNKGMDPRGAACRLGGAPRAGELILVTEGLATGLTLCMAVEHKHPVFVAFSANNLPEVVRILRQLHATSPIVVCADDDAYVDASLNKLLRENYRLEELVQAPLTERMIAGEVKEAAGWVKAPIRVSIERVVDGNAVPGLIAAVQVGDRVQTITRENAGRKYANLAAAAVENAGVVHPVFADRKLPADPDCAKLTDFNDLHRAEGLEAVKRLLKPELEQAAFNAKLNEAVRAQLAKARRDGKKKDAGGGRGEPPGPNDAKFDFDGFLKRFTLIYPTDTLWDAQLQEIVKLNPVRIHFGDRIISWWLESKDRRTVNFQDLVFEPDGKAAPNSINLYRGMPLKPSKRGSCEMIIKLLQFLCREEDQHNTPVTDHVMKWIAVPLKRPGAKLQSAIVMHGGEGTGKNLFWGVVRDIYGEYGTLITQTELEDRFNGWLSRRLLLIANEVISRQELRHHVGRLKNMVTEGVLPIREMFTPIRYETNHANLVFLTNELQALQISPDDRRYLVIRTPAKAPKAFYKEVAAEIAAGGVEAFYQRLLDLDLGDFNEHTEPIMTEAKSDLIEIGLSSTQLFQKHLHDGLLYPLQYRPCQSMDLYEAYQVFCARTGERNPARLNRFSHEFKQMNGVTWRVVDVDDAVAKSAGVRRRQATVFIMGEIPDDAKGSDPMFRSYLKKNIAEFKGDLVEWKREGRHREGEKSREHGSEN